VDRRREHGQAEGDQPLDRCRNSSRNSISDSSHYEQSAQSRPGYYSSRTAEQDQLGSGMIIKIMLKSEISLKEKLLMLKMTGSFRRTESEIS